MGGKVQKLAIIRPIVPTLWPIQEGINLTQKDVTTIEEVGFPLTTCVETMLKVYLASNLLIQVINSHVLLVSCHSPTKLFDASC